MIIAFAPFSRRLISRLALVFGLAGALIGLTACGEKANAGAAGAKGGAKGKKGGGAAPVVVAKVERKIVPVEIEAIGAVEAIRTTGIRSQITGVVQKIAIQEGQDVNQGDLLFEIDSRPFRNALKSAEADRQKIQVQLEYAHGQVARYRELSSGSMVSKEQFQKIQDDARALEAQAQVSESAIASAKLQLEYSSIRAPIAGRSGHISVHEGDLIRANEAGAPLVTINQLSPIYVTFGVPQQYLSAINRYRAQGKLAVRVVPPGLNEPPETGELTFIDNTVDSSTGTIKLKATFTNESNRLWPGQFGTVSTTLANPEALAIPSSAVQNSQNGQHVFVVKSDNTAEKREVVVERTHHGDAVITRGLVEGETVVTEGQLRVVPGGPLDIRSPGGGSSTEGGQAKGTEKGKKQT